MIGFEWLLPIITQQAIAFIVGTYKDDSKEYVKNKLKLVDWKIHLDRYRQKVEEDYGHITLILSGNEKVTLDNFFIDVELLTNSYNVPYQASQRISGKTLITRYDNNENLGINESHQFLYILGHPGTGKTTFLKYAAHLASTGVIQKIPIFINLLDWSRSGLGLMDFMAREFDICGFPESQSLIKVFLDEGKVIVLFDGLDEVSQNENKRNKVITEIKNLCRAYKGYKNLFLMTCRIAASGYIFEDFVRYKIAAFTEKQILAYIGNWFRNKPINLRQNLEREICDVKNQRFLEMAGQPLLLSLICFSYYKNKSFPQRKIDIYETAIDALLKEWDDAKGVDRDFYKDLPVETKKAMIAKIAFDGLEEVRFFNKFQKSSLEDSVAEHLSELFGLHKELVPSQDILKSIEAQHGILVEEEDKIYRFPHLSFQEYFATQHVIKNRLLAELLTPAHILSNRWYEVILNTRDLSEIKNDFFEFFQSGLNQMIADDAKLADLFLWAEKKAKNDTSDKKLYEKRFYYFYIAVVSDHNFYLPLTKALEFDTTIDLKVSHEYVADVDYAIDSDIRRGKKLSSELEFAIDCLSSMDLNIEHCMDFSFYTMSLYIYCFRFDNYGYVSNKKSIIDKMLKCRETIVQHSFAINKQNLGLDLRKFAVPQKKLNSEEYRHSILSLNKIMLERCDLRVLWGLTSKQVNTFADYCVWTRWLIDSVNQFRDCINDEEFKILESRFFSIK